jgi:RNA polymerase sigma factor (sigma-70 family)
MKRGPTQTLVRDLEILYHVGTVPGLTDRELLGQFTVRDSARAHQAFGAIVHRHGPMVLAVCNRVLRDQHAAEDAFQATFLVLALKAGTIRKRDALGPWLYGVAARISRRARALSHRRSEQQLPSLNLASCAPAGSEVDLAELRSVLDEEVDRLPATYRRAIVLCYIEGKTQEEVARLLGWSKGTVSGRLARAKDLLRARLSRRGFAPSAGLLGLVLSDETARAAVPVSLVDRAVQSAVCVVLGRAESVAASSTVTALAQSAVRAMLLAKVKLAAVALLVLMAFATAMAQTGSRPALPDQVGAAKAPRAVAAQTATVEPSRPARTLSLEVVSEADNAPLPGAAVWAQVNWGQSRGSQAKTDDEGRCTIAIPGQVASFLRVVVIHRGFAPIELKWTAGEPIPETYTVAVDRGAPIGGTVRDQKGRPIAGARVHPVVSAAPPRGGRARYPGRESDFAAAITDQEGRWQSEALPASIRAETLLELVTRHPDYVGLRQTVTAASLRAFAADGVMWAGRSLSGTIESPTGRPVAGATVTVQSRSDRTALERVQSDTEGRFRTGRSIDPAWTEFTMVVQADGFASSAHLLLVSPEIPPQTVRLSPRRPLHGRVVDALGRPVAGAIVISPREFGYAGLDWQAESDLDGRFVWYEAPVTGSYMLNVVKPPFRQIMARMVQGGSDEITLTLHHPQRVHGTVTDAETDGPIETFVLIPGSGPHRPGWPLEWHRNSPHSFTGGKFDLTGPNIEQGGYRSIRIEAEGYEPAEFLRFRDSLEDVAHDFKLKKAVPLSGIVRGPDGRPVAGVDVGLSGVGYDAPIVNGRLQPGSGHHSKLRDRTGPDGRYAFPPQGHRVSVVAVHDTGIAIRSATELAASTDLVLAPWGRIEGVAKIENKPAAGQRVAGWLLTPLYSDRIGSETRTDDSGRFVFDRVAPGRTIICRRVDHPDKQGWTFSHPLYLDVKPGETVQLQLGGMGRPVVGRLTMPVGVTLDHLNLGQGALTSPRRDLPVPADYLELDSEQRSTWWEAFSRTPVGRVELENRERYYAVDLRPDGTFRIEDVPAGRYVLKLPFEGLSRGTREGRQAFAHCDVVVPEIPGGRSDLPLDIGAIPLEVFPFHERNVGERAPAIVAPLPDGPPLDLATLHGKFVLLHFWSGRPEDTAVVPDLKATYDAFGRDQRFVMIGLIADETPGPVLRYAALRGLDWEQRYIGSTYDPNPIEAAFGVWFPPAAFLIGPDGRILAKDLEGEAIKEAVGKALAKAP